MNIKLTTLESKVLNYLGTDVWSGWYSDGKELTEEDDPHYSDISASGVCFKTGISKTSIGGVLGSLSKKGLISLREYDNGFKRRNLIYLTAATCHHFRLERDILQDFYLEYRNHYTISAFASDKGITEADARLQIEIGRKIHNQRTSK
jgi:DNA-binding MarR family transcriptional regulator